jgi:hypothetical protein
MRCLLVSSFANYATPKALRDGPFPGTRLANHCRQRHTLPIPERLPALRRSPARRGSTELIPSRASLWARSTRLGFARCLEQWPG